MKLTIQTSIYLAFFLVSCGNKGTHGVTPFDSTAVSIDTTAFDSLATEPSTIKDVDGNVYKVITIGNQVWMAENLKTTKYNDGSEISHITDKNLWDGCGQGAYCWYDNNSVNKASYGAIYNWYAVNTSKLAPKGWHIPTDDEWKELENYLGEMAGDKLREKGKSHWKVSQSIATNKSGFTALPGGVFSNSFFEKIGEEGYWWSSTEDEDNRAVGICLLGDKSITPCSPPRHYGISVRCIKDNSSNSHLTSNSSDINWLMGVWEVQTNEGLMILTILDSHNATFLGERGTYTIDNSILKWNDKPGSVTTFKLNCSNQTIDGGGGYVLRKRSGSINNNQTNKSSNTQSSKVYKRTSRDYFSCTSAVYEFLANHTFVSSDGSRLTYDMSELRIAFTSGKPLIFTNVEILGYNQDVAKIRAMWIGNGSTTSFLINASTGTVTDSDGTLHQAVN